VFALTLILVIGGGALAQGIYPPLEGGVADGAGVLSVSDVQAAIDRLARQTRATPIALTYNNSHGLSADDYEKGFLEENGFGRPGVNINARVIMIAINYQDRVVKIWYGDMWLAALDPTIQDIQNQYVIPYAAEEPTQAFVNGFEQIGKAIERHRHPPTPVPPVVEVEETHIDTSGIGRAIWRIARWVLPTAFLSIILGVVSWVLATRVWPEWRKRSRLIKEISEHRRTLSLRITEVANRLPSAYVSNASMAQLLLVMDREQPKRTKTLRQEYEKQRQELFSIQKRVRTYGRRSAHILIEPDQLKILLQGYKQLEEERKTIISWLNTLDKEAEQVRQAVAVAPAKVEAAKKSLTTVVNKYSTAAAGSQYLPPTEEGMAVLTQLIQQAEAELTEGKPLTATEVTGELRKATKAFKDAFQAIVEAEGLLGATAPKLAEVIGERHEVATVEEILSQPATSVKQACELMNEGQFNEAATTAKEAIVACEEALSNVAHLIQVIGERDRRNAALQKLTEAGYKAVKLTRTALAEAEKDLKRANRALQKGSFAEAGRWTTELDTDSQQALEVMQQLDSLCCSNDERLSALAINVAKAEQRRVQEAKPKWQELQSDFHPANWDNVAANFDQATKLLASLFDDPSDSDDLASQAARLNSLEAQDFDGADHILDRMEADLAQAVLLMDQLETQHRKTVEAREHYQQALKQAGKKLEQAGTLRGEQDRFVGPDVDQLLLQAKQALADAQTFAEAEVYVEAMGLCQDVHGLCDEAMASITKQVARIQNWIREKEEAKAAARSIYDEAQAAIEQVTRAAVRRATRNKLTAAVAQIELAGQHEVRALTLEDHQMADALEQSKNAYVKAGGLAIEAKSSLQEDVKSYKQLLSQARQAVDKAQTAIRAAERECSDYRSNSAGNSALRRAKSLLPAISQNGDTRRAIKRAIENAEAARKEAKKAEGQAEDEVAAYISRQEAAARRRRATTYSPSGSGGWGGGSSFGGSFGGGGSSSRGGF